MTSNSFIEEIAPIIQKVAKERGYKVCSPVIAQACCESAYGKSILGYKYHNYFGMKCGSYWKGKSVNLKTKEEYTVGTLTTIRDNFRVYDSMEEGVNGYFYFINTKRYANLKTATTPQKYLEYIKADGYATSSTYVSTNMRYINLHNLTDWDWLEETSEDCPYKEPTANLRKGAKGSVVKWIQWHLNKFDSRNNLTIDGIWGAHTQLAVLDAQGRLGLIQDGIVGVKTRTALKNAIQ